MSDLTNSESDHQQQAEIEVKHTSFLSYKPKFVPRFAKCNTILTIFQIILLKHCHMKLTIRCVPISSFYFSRLGWQTMRTTNSCHKVQEPTLYRYIRYLNRTRLIISQSQSTTEHASCTKILAR